MIRENIKVTPYRQSIFEQKMDSIENKETLNYNKHIKVSRSAAKVPSGIKTQSQERKPFNRKPHQKRQSSHNKRSISIKNQMLAHQSNIPIHSRSPQNRGSSQPFISYRIQ